ncbi:sensor histidine kinase [Paenibacillus koleovorans]|uniref:sensor histidine kinase n=1 Tax=Paenibacillus koleovorans TaxID=121608 RepID=UPI000FD736EB|nr:sensor histidine kinase [Paenibacillus koleovorans]
MKWRFSNLKLNYQFGLIVVFAVLLVGIVQTIYYVQITRVTERKVETFTRDSMSQAVGTMNMIFDRTAKAAVFFSYSNSVQSFLSARDPLDIFHTQKVIEDMIKTGIEMNTEIQNVVLVTPEWKRIYYYSDTQVSDALDRIQERTERQGDRYSGFVYLPGDPISKRDSIAYLMPVYSSTPDSRLGEKLGSIIVFLNPDLLKQIVGQAAQPENVQFYIEDDGGKWIASNSEMAEQAINHPVPGREISIRQEIGRTEWTLVGIVLKDNVVRDYQFFRGFTMIVGGIMLLLLLALAWVFHRSFAKPVTRLLREIGAVGEGDFYKQISNRYRSEIGGIALHINRMLRKLEGLNNRHLDTLQRVYQIEISRKQTELYALRSQVNPHFLFNTMQCIGGIALAREVPEIAQMTVSMSEIFKYAVRGEDEVQVQEELFIVEQYLKIIDIRFAGKFHWTFDIEPELYSKTIMKMVLQPLVENAVYHGLEKSYNEGHLRITGRVMEQSIQLEVWDNGPGMNEATLDKIQQMLAHPVELEKESIGRQKIGLANIHWRIRLQYGEAYGLRVSSSAELGTVIQIKLPLLANNELNTN